MRTFLLVAGVLALACCGRIQNSFVVEDAEGPVRSATLDLCASKTPMNRVAGGFRLSAPITCEGEGLIALSYRNGRSEACRIGYVTTGAEQHFRFRAEPTSCSPAV